MVLNEQVVELEQELALMQRDLQLVQDDAALKRWLNEQAKETRRQMREAARMGFA
jgi:cell division inhibitor SulA